MKFHHNFQNSWKGKFCNHIYIDLEEYGNGIFLKKCIRCFRIFENQEY